MFVVSRYDDVARVLLDGETFSSSMLAEVMGPAMGEHIILGPKDARGERLTPGGVDERRPVFGHPWSEPLQAHRGE